MKTEAYVVRLGRPDATSVERLVAYMREAIYWWGGQFFPGDEDEPGDPLYYPWTFKGTRGPTAILIARMADPDSPRVQKAFHKWADVNDRASLKDAFMAGMRYAREGVTLKEHNDES